MDSMDEEEILLTDESPTSSAGFSVSPHFALPEGVEGTYADFDVDEPESEVFEPLTDEANDGNEPSYSGEEVSPVSDQFEEALTEGDDILLPPTELQIISQKVKFGPSGAGTVDVVLGFEEADGAETYEVRVSKI